MEQQLNAASDRLIQLSAISPTFGSIDIVPLPTGVSHFISYPAMFNFSSSKRPWFYPILALVTALSIWLATPMTAQAISWLDLIFQGVQILQLSNISDQQEVDIGRQMNQELLSTEFRPYTDPSINQYVTQIGQRLVPVSDRPNIPYTFQVVQDPNINAFATMGGFVYITTGLLRAADNEAQVASVLGHEIGHIGGKHLIEQLRQTAIQRGIATAAGLDQSTAVGLGVELVLNRPNSRQAEFDADQRGLKSLTRAGYAPSAMVAFMQKLNNSSNVPEFLSTHPATGERINALRSRIPANGGNSGEGLNTNTYKARVKALI